MWERYRDSSYTSCAPPTCIASSPFRILASMIQLLQPMTLHHYSLCNRAHSCCCPFCGFGQTYNNMSPPLSSRTESFPCPKNSPGSTYSFLPPPSSFYCLHSFASSRKSYSWNYTVCSHHILPYFT